MFCLEVIPGGGVSITTSQWRQLAAAVEAEDEEEEVEVVSVVGVIDEQMEEKKRLVFLFLVLKLFVFKDESKISKSFGEKVEVKGKVFVR